MRRMIWTLPVYTWHEGPFRMLLILLKLEKNPQERTYYVKKYIASMYGKSFQLT